MRYTSTRNNTISSTFEDALCSGYAPDGGLYVPEYIPTTTKPIQQEQEQQQQEEKDIIQEQQEQQQEHHSSSSSSRRRRTKILLQQWMKLSYIELAYEVIRPFISVDEIPNDDLKYIFQKSYNHDSFHIPKTKKTTKTTTNDDDDDDQDDVVFVRKLVTTNDDDDDDDDDDNKNNNDNNNKNANNNNNSHIYLSELFHGPTYCFKDFGMRPIIHMLSYFANKKRRNNNKKKKKKRITLLVSTTGDTGPAAIRAVSDINDPRITLLVHYPQNQISNFQRKQLTTIQSPYVHVVSFQGSGDDMDIPIKNLLLSMKNNNNNNTNRQQQQNDNDDNDYNNNNDNDDEDDDEILWTGVNSYNIGRPLMQMIHFIWTYLRVVEMEQQEQQQMKMKTKKEEEEDNDDNDKDEVPIIVDMLIPTGAMGNIVGAYMAKQFLGTILPSSIGKLIAVCNINDITHRVIQTGKFMKHHSMYKTMSDAINIQIPYNFERLLYYLTNQNDILIRKWMKQFEQQQETTTNNNDDNNNQQINLNDDIIIDSSSSSSSSSSHTTTTTTITWFDKLQQEFQSASVTDEQMCYAMRTIYKNHNGYLMDPHTSVAMSGAIQLGYYYDNTCSNATSSNHDHDHDDNVVNDDNDTNQYYQNKHHHKKNDDEHEHHHHHHHRPLAIFCTASPCKFEESVTIAMGKDIWEQYSNSNNNNNNNEIIEPYYPASARTLLQQQQMERKPTIYKADSNKTLEENQKVWENMSRQIIIKQFMNKNKKN